MKYGYQQNQQTGSSINADGGLVGAMKEALLDFQFLAGINQTGVLDQDTEKMMTMPRCGVRDHIRRGTRNNNRLYLGTIGIVAAGFS